YETIQRRDRDRPHPATFPSLLPEQCLRLHGVERIEQVMDPFTGLGSTAVACARLGLNFLGADIDEVYLTEAAARMSEAGDTSLRALPSRGNARMAKSGLRPAHGAADVVHTEVRR